MTNLPDPQTLATLVSNVTETMCGISFEPTEDSQPLDPAAWRLAILPIKGKRQIQVLLSSDQASSMSLGAALLGFPPEQLDSSMIDDSLCELLNMAAGQIKRALAVDDALGLPKIVQGEAGQKLFKTARNHGTMLRSRSSHGLIIWVTESLEQGS